MLLPATAGHAGGVAQIDITPLFLTLGEVGDSKICTIDNFGSVATNAQIRVKAWRQDGGRDVLEDTADLGASPPFMSLAPGSEQLVRLVNLAAAPGPVELAFRVLLNQVPTAGEDSGPGVHVLMAISLPLFILGASAAPPQMQAAFASTAAGVVLRVVNQGDIHARLVDVTVRDAGGATLFKTPGLAGYVLARSTRDFPTRLRNLPPPGAAMIVTTQVSKTPLVVPLTTNL